MNCTAENIDLRVVHDDAVMSDRSSSTRMPQLVTNGILFALGITVSAVVAKLLKGILVVSGIGFVTMALAKTQIPSANRIKAWLGMETTSWGFVESYMDWLAYTLQRRPELCPFAGGMMMGAAYF